MRRVATIHPRGLQKKFTGDVKDPFEQERSIQELTPTPEQTKDDILAVLEEIENSGNVSADEQKALTVWRANYLADGIEDDVKKQFISDFWSWLLGRGRPQDVARTPWGRQSLADDKEVAAYCDFFIDKQVAYRKKLQFLAMRRPVGIYECLLYYKYIVRDGLDKDRPFDVKFLKDWTQFGKDFDDARAAGQEHRRPLGNAHDMAPYEDFRGERRTDKKTIPPGFRGPKGGPKPPKKPKDESSSDEEDTADDDDKPPPPGPDMSGVVSQLTEIAALLKKDIESRRLPPPTTSSPTDKPPPPPPSAPAAPAGDRLQRPPPPPPPAAAAVKIPVKVPPVDAEKKRELARKHATVNYGLRSEERAQIEAAQKARDEASLQRISSLETKLLEYEKNNKISSTVAAQRIEQLEKERLAITADLENSKVSATRVKELESELAATKHAMEQQQEAVRKVLTSGSYARETKKYLDSKLAEVKAGYVSDLDQWKAEVDRLKAELGQRMSQEDVKASIHEYETNLKKHYAAQQADFMQRLAARLQEFQGNYEQAVRAVQQSEKAARIEQEQKFAQLRANLQKASLLEGQQQLRAIEPKASTPDVAERIYNMKKTASKVKDRQVPRMIRRVQKDFAPEKKQEDATRAKIYEVDSAPKGKEEEDTVPVQRPSPVKIVESGSKVMAVREEEVDKYPGVEEMKPVKLPKAVETAESIVIELEEAMEPVIEELNKAQAENVRMAAIAAARVEQAHADQLQVKLLENASDLMPQENTVRVEILDDEEEVNETVAEAVNNAKRTANELEETVENSERAIVKWRKAEEQEVERAADEIKRVAEQAELEKREAQLEQQRLEEEARLAAERQKELEVEEAFMLKELEEMNARNERNLQLIKEEEERVAQQRQLELQRAAKELEDAEKLQAAYDAQIAAAEQAQEKEKQAKLAAEKKAEFEREMAAREAYKQKEREAAQAELKRQADEAERQKRIEEAWQVALAVREKKEREKEAEAARQADIEREQRKAERKAQDAEEEMIAAERELIEFEARAQEHIQPPEARRNPDRKGRYKKSLARKTAPERRNSTTSANHMKRVKQAPGGSGVGVTATSMRSMMRETPAENSNVETRSQVLEGELMAAEVAVMEQRQEKAKAEDRDSEEETEREVERELEMEFEDDPEMLKKKRK